MTTNQIRHGQITGAAATFSPTITQVGSVTLTTATGRYFLVGNLCYLHCFIDFGGTGGTAGNDLVLGNIPTAIAPLASGEVANSSGQSYIGSGVYFDSGTAMYSLTGYFASSSTLKFIEANTISGNKFGTTPSMTPAAADSMSFDIVYEISG